MSDTISEKEFWNEQAKLKRVLAKKPKVPFRKIKEEVYHLPTSLKGIQEATMNCLLVIDKMCILTYPLDDPRTGPALRALYLAQEELMMQPEDIPEEELSSPANDHKEEDVSSITILKTLSEEQVKVFQKQNSDYLKQVYPELY